MNNVSRGTQLVHLWVISLSSQCFQVAAVNNQGINRSVEEADEVLYNMKIH